MRKPCCNTIILLIITLLTLGVFFNNHHAHSSSKQKDKAQTLIPKLIDTEDQQTYELYEAIKEREIDKLKAILTKNPDLNIYSFKRKQTPLGMAISNRTFSYPFFADLSGDKYHNFSFTMDYKTINMLLDKGAKIYPHDAREIYGLISEGDAETLELLIKNGLSAKHPIGGHLPVVIAESKNRKDARDMLIKYGASPIKDTEAIQLRFIQATEEANIDAMSTELGKGADINGIDLMGRTALARSCRRPAVDQSPRFNWYAPLQFLLDHGADPNKKENLSITGIDGTPLHLYIYFNSMVMNDSKRDNALPVKGFELLLEKKAYISDRGYKGATPLHIAAESDNIYAAKRLLELGAPVTVRDNNGNTPIDIAKSTQMLAVLRGSPGTSDKDSSKETLKLSHGTGWLINKNTVITNYHVVKDRSNIILINSEKLQLEATIKYSDPSNDISVLQLKATLDSAPFQLSSKQIPIGAKILTIGFPLPSVMGITPKLTDGIVNSAFGPGDDPRYYQISAAVQPGNSGGPLINTDGTVAGIVSSKLNPSKIAEKFGQPAENVSYAIKNSYLTAMLDSLGVDYSRGTNKESSPEELFSKYEKSVFLVVAK